MKPSSFGPCHRGRVFLHHRRSTVRFFVFAGLVSGNRWSSNGIRSETPVNPSKIKFQDYPVRGVFFLGEIRTADLRVVVYPCILWTHRKDIPLYDAVIPKSMQRTLFPEPDSSGKSVLYFVLDRHLFPLLMPRLTK